MSVTAPAASAPDPPREDARYVITVRELDELVGALREQGYRVIGPVVRDGAIGLAEIGSAAELPYGWGVAANRTSP